MYKFANKAPDGNVLWVVIPGQPPGCLIRFPGSHHHRRSPGAGHGLVDGDRFIRPIFELVRPVPPLPGYPLVVVWMGIGLKARLSLLSFHRLCAVRHQFLYRHKADQQDVNQCIQDLQGLQCGDILESGGVPSSLPMVFAMNPVMWFGNSWSTLVAAEMLAASAGLGYMIPDWPYSGPPGYRNCGLWW